MTRADMLLLRVQDLSISTRARGVLEWAEIEYVWQLIQCKPSDLRPLPNCGKITINIIRETLAEYGLYLGMSDVAPEIKGGLEYIQRPNCGKIVWMPKIYPQLAAYHIRRYEKLSIGDSEFIEEEYT